MGKLYIYSSACIPRGLALLVYSSHYFHFPVVSNLILLSSLWPKHFLACLLRALSCVLIAFLPSCLSDSHSCNQPPPNLHLILARIEILQVFTCFTSLPSFLPSWTLFYYEDWSESNCQTIINQAPYFNKSLRTVHSNGLSLVTATLQPRVLLYLQLCLTGCKVRGANNSWVWLAFRCSRGSIY